MVSINNDMLEMLTSREQLMEDIIAIVDGELSGIISDRLSDELTTRLCDAVCKNFPTKWYPGQLPVENFYSTGQSLICPLSLDFCLRSCIVDTWTTHQATTPTWTTWLRWVTIGQTVRWSLLLVWMPPILGWSMVGPLTLRQNTTRHFQIILMVCDPILSHQPVD